MIVKVLCGLKMFAFAKNGFVLFEHNFIFPQLKRKRILFNTRGKNLFLKTQSYPLKIFSDRFSFICFEETLREDV